MKKGLVPDYQNEIRMDEVMKKNTKKRVCDFILCNSVSIVED